MRVKIEYHVDANEDTRRAINMHYGRPGLATRHEVKRWYEAFGHSMDDDLSWSLQENDEAIDAR